MTLRMHRAQAAAAVNIWAVATKKLIATTVIGPQNASAAEGGFAYVDLATPVVLQQGQAYYVTQTCHSNQPDRFTNSDANAGAADQRLAALGSSVYSPQGSPGVFPTQLGHGSQFAGVATFKTTVPVSGPCPFHLGIGPYRLRFTYVTPVLVPKLRMETARTGQPAPDTGERVRLLRPGGGVRQGLRHHHLRRPAGQGHLHHRLPSALRALPA
jgi:hypothetical protein